MPFVNYNPNPISRIVNDCAVRAISKALNIDWETAYILLCTNGLAMGDMPSSKSVVSATLRQNGFYRAVIENTCPDCYSAADFCFDHPDGVYVLAFDNHIATVVDGMIYDTWNSSDEVPLFYWYRKEQ